MYALWMVGRSSQVMALSKEVHHLDTGEGPTAAIGTTIDKVPFHSEVSMESSIYIYIVSLDQHPPFATLLRTIYPHDRKLSSLHHMLRIHSVSLLSFSLHVPCPSLNAKRHHVGVLYLNHPICGPPLIKPNISSHMTSLYIYHWINGINSLVYYHELERDLADGTFQSSRGKLQVNQ